MLLYMRITITITILPGWHHLTHLEVNMWCNILAFDLWRGDKSGLQRSVISFTPTSDEILLSLFSVKSRVTMENLRTFTTFDEGVINLMLLFSGEIKIKCKCNQKNVIKYGY